jgi:4-aminobutyrate aminotransferase/(S)-3-amino-2-methylpropionate transaminase
VAVAERGYTAASMRFRTLVPELRGDVPGPRSRTLAQRLARVESRNVTCLAPLPPIFWERASAANVWDVDGNRFVDLGAAFGVANVGHAHPRVVEAVTRQAGVLLHGMGDVQPSVPKVELLERLSESFPGPRGARGVLVTSGSDAVEVALKTALLATGRPGLVAFEGAYHGLSLGALDATWRRDFRGPFEALLPRRTAFARYGDAADAERAVRECPVTVGAILVEAVQGRGGDRVPPRDFLPSLRALCDREGLLLVVDEVYTGFGRTGRWFACEHVGVAPDLLCVGKGLSSGMPLAACLGQAGVMDAWPESEGEALHTQTFLGHPVGCAAALAALEVLREEKLPDRAAALGGFAVERLRSALVGAPSVREVRGLGLMIGIECETGEQAQRAALAALRRGVILLPSGDDGRVLSITPPLTIERAILEHALAVVVECLA